MGILRIKKNICTNGTTHYTRTLRLAVKILRVENNNPDKVEQICNKTIAPKLLIYANIYMVELPNYVSFSLKWLCRFCG